MFVLTGFWSQAQNKVIVHAPSLSPDGNQVAFSYQGDIWTYDLGLKKGTRITIHKGYETNPVWNGSGTALAFSGARYGNNDVFVADLQSGAIDQLTYYSAADNVTDWSKKNGILFSTDRAFQQVEWDSELYAVSEKGETPRRVLDAVGGMAVESPDGNFIAFTRGACRVAREDYNGPSDQEVWIFNKKTKSFNQITNNDKNDYLPKFDNQSNLYFISASSGRYNIVKQTIDKNGAAVGIPAPITSYKDVGVQHFGLSSNKIIYTRGADLYHAGINGEKPTVVDLKLSQDSRFDNIENKTFSAQVDGFQIAPNGKNIVMEIHGEIFVKQNDKDKKRSMNVSNHPFRDTDGQWLNDSTVLFISDRSGYSNLFMATSADPNKSDLSQTLKVKIQQLTKEKTNVSDLAIAPDGSKIVFVKGGGQLVLASVEVKSGKLSQEKELLAGWSTPSGVAWSPDGKWLAYTQQDLNFNREVFIMPVDQSRKPINVSMHPRSDSNPFWSPDGSKLGFSSNRYNDNDIFFVWLKKEDWEKTQEDRDYGYYFEEEVQEEKEKKDKVAPVIIDADKIYDRLVRVTAHAGDEYGALISKDGEKFYFMAGTKSARGFDLFEVKWDGKDLKQISKGGARLRGLQFDPAVKKLYAVKSGSIKQIEPSGKMNGLPHRAKMVVNHQKEKEQIFEDAWRTLEALFYDPQYHGYDFAALKKQYKPWALAASTRQDFRYFYNLMLGQLNASHMGLYGPNPERTQRNQTGKIGIEAAPHASGVLVQHVVPNTPADKKISRLYKGDVITAVNGQPVKGKNFYYFLNNNVSEELLLTVKRKSGKEEEIAIRPVQSIGTEMYEEWVASRQKLVEKYSGGKLGYIHIRGMNMTSFERFERELHASGYEKDGIVIDVRYNGGGWTTDYLMAVLNVRQHAYTVPRGAATNLKAEHKKFENYYPYSERLPLSWWTKPSVALCNESSYSNAEIFSHAYKHLGHGKLVGKPTFGAVISTGGQSLMDGSRVRVPYRAWYVKATNSNMEHGPAVPDFDVDNLPDSKIKGEDPQLKKAVEVLLNPSK